MRMECSLIDGVCATVRAQNAIVAEAYAIRKACVVAASFRSVVVTVETYCKELFDPVTEACKALDWRLALVLFHIQRSFHPSLRLGLITCHANKVADWVAKSTAKSMCPVGWVAIPSSPLAIIMMRNALGGFRRTGLVKLTGWRGDCCWL